MRIYFAAQLHNFELRWRFFVNAMLQQRIPRGVSIIVDCATLEGDDNPRRIPSALCPYLVYFPTRRDIFARRGRVRDQQVQRAIAFNADWIYFTDADHIFPPEYVEALTTLCKSRRYRKTDRCLFDWSKQTTTERAANKAVAMAGGDAWIVDNAYDRLGMLPQEVKGPNMHAGGAMQLARVAAIVRNNGGRYIHPRYRKSWDRNMFDGQRARSDWQFRATMGEHRIRLQSRPPIHANHRRDKAAGYHLEEQR